MARPAITPRGNVERLPKWAQSHIKSLTRRVAYLEGELGEGSADSDTFLDPYDVPRPLGLSAHIQFRLGANPGEDDHTTNIHARTSTDHKGRSYVDIMAGRSLSVVPASSNTVRLYAFAPGD